MMQKFKMLLFCTLLHFSVTGCLQSALSEKQQNRQDSLVNAAKWELYKQNIRSFESPTKYVSCNDQLVPFINFDVGSPKWRQVGDTIRYFFYMQPRNCVNHLSKSPPVGILFVWDDGSYWNPYDGVIYVSKKLHKICSDDICGKPLIRSDSILVTYIDSHRDSITNQWLLDYYDNTIKKHLVKKQSK
jgi:hypothetical protein